MSPLWLLIRTQAECKSKYSVNFQLQSTLESHAFLCLHAHEKQEAVNEDLPGNGVLEAVAGEDA